MTQNDAVNKKIVNELIRKTGRAFYEAVKLLPKKIRYPLAIGYLLGRVADTITDDIPLPVNTKVAMLSELLLSIQQGSLTNIEKFKPALEALAEHSEFHNLFLHLNEILSAYAKLDSCSRNVLQKNLIVIIEAQCKEILFFMDENQLHCLDTVEQYQDYLYAFAGSVGVCWTEICLNSYPDFSDLPKAQLLDYASELGKGTQIINFLSDFPQDVQQNRCYFPLPLLRQKDIDLNSLRDNPHLLRPLLPELLQHAANDFQSGWLYMLSIRLYRLRFAILVTILFCFAARYQIENTPYLETKKPVKISRMQAVIIALIAAIGALSPRILSFLLKLTPYRKYLK